MASSSSNTKLIVSTNKKTGTEIDEECGRASKAPQPPVSPIPEDQVKVVTISQQVIPAVVKNWPSCVGNRR